MKKSRKSSYTCLICNRTFSQFSSIGGHVAGHVKRGEIPSRRRGKLEIPGEVKCDICGRTLKSPHGVIIHKAQRHGYKSKRLKESTVISSQEILNPSEVAADLLSLVVDRINRDSNLNNQIAALNNQIFELEGLLKKESEEKERILRVHNKVVEESRYKIPKIEEIVSALRREHIGGKPL